MAEEEAQKYDYKILMRWKISIVGGISLSSEEKVRTFQDCLVGYSCFRGVG